MIRAALVVPASLHYDGPSAFLALLGFPHPWADGLRVSYRLGFGSQVEAEAAAESWRVGVDVDYLGGVRL